MSKSGLRVFLCHASQDKAAVRDLRHRLVHSGFQPWLDEDDLLPGQDWALEIPKAVRQSDIVLVCLSDASTRKSGYVQKEIREALDVADQQPEGRLFIIPVRLDQCVVPERLKRWQWVDLYSTDGYEKLQKSLTQRYSELSRRHPEPRFRPEPAKEAKSYVTDTAPRTDSIFNVPRSAASVPVAFEKASKLSIARTYMLWVVGLLIAAASTYWLITNVSADRSGPEGPRIAVLSPAKIGVLDELIAGFRMQMETEMSGRPYHITEWNALGEVSRTREVISNALSQRQDVLVSIATPLSYTAISIPRRSVPVCFMGVTDPIGAGIVKSLDHPGSCTGVVDLPPIEKTIGLMRQMLPTAKSIGLIFSPDVMLSVASRDLIKRSALQHGFTITEIPISSPADISDAIRRAALATDALLTGLDFSLDGRWDYVSKLCLEAKKPWFAADSNCVRAGAVAGYCIDYLNVGREGAKLVARIVRGETAGTIPVKRISDGVFEFNPRSMQMLGLAVPDGIKGSAKIVAQ